VTKIDFDGCEYGIFEKAARVSWRSACGVLLEYLRVSGYQGW